jgi:transposase
MSVFTNVTWDRLLPVGGLFFMSYFLGFDVAKSKLDYALINEQGIEQDYGKVVNEEVAIATFLLTVTGAYPDMSITCVAEATGGFQDKLTDVCHMLGLPCLTYNPLLTKQQTRATVRGKKTDRSDAFLVARVGWSGGGRLHTPEPYRNTKHYARSCQKLSILSSSFRQYKTHITGLLGGELTSDAETLLAGIQTAIREARSQLYKDLAVSAQGDVFRLLQTIPGVGPYVAASIVGEIQDIRRFNVAKELTAFAGLDPKVRQSGKALNSTGKLTKRGSTYLRRSLFIAAGVARQHDPQFQALYDKKRAEGKSYTVATCVVARKLLLVARSVWLHEKSYGIPDKFV